MVLSSLVAERRAEQSLDSKLRETGPGGSVSRFLAKYGNVRTKAAYAVELGAVSPLADGLGLLRAGPRMKWLCLPSAYPPKERYELRV